MDPRGGSGSHRLELAPHYESTKSPTSVFILPPEIRQAIWEYALPDRRILEPFGRFDKSLRDWVILFNGVVGKPRQPSLTQVCRETRHFMLRNGDFIFGKGPTEPGLWWNSKLDTLIFTYEWDLRFETNALEGLRGLDKVKNVIIDEESAGYLSVLPIFAKSIPQADDESDWLPGGCWYPVGFRFCYPDSHYFKFFLFNGIYPDNLTIFFRGLSPYQRSALQGPPWEEFDYDSLSDVCVEFQFLDDEVDDVVQKLNRLSTLWEKSQEPSRHSGWGKRYSWSRNELMAETLDKRGPLLRKGASDENEGEYDVDGPSYFNSMPRTW